MKYSVSGPSLSSAATSKDSSSRASSDPCSWATVSGVEEAFSSDVKSESGCEVSSMAAESWLSPAVDLDATEPSVEEGAEVSVESLEPQPISPRVNAASRTRAKPLVHCVIEIAFPDSAGR